MSVSPVNSSMFVGIENKNIGNEVSKIPLPRDILQFIVEKILMSKKSVLKKLEIVTNFRLVSKQFACVKEMRCFSIDEVYVLDNFIDAPRNRLFYQKILGLSNANADNVKYVQSAWEAVMLKNDPKLILEYLNYPGVDPTLHCNYLIQYAASIQHLDLLKKLLTNEKVDPNAGGEYSPLRKAARKGYLSVVQELLKCERVDPTNDSNGAFLDAFRKGRSEIMQELLNHKKVDPNTIFIDASINGHFGVLRELLKHDKLDLSAYGNKAFLNACANGHLEIVQELLKYKEVDPAVNNNQAFKDACANGHLEIVQELLKHNKVNLTADVNRGFLNACVEGRFEIVQELLSYENLKFSDQDLKILKITLKITKRNKNKAISGVLEKIIKAVAKP